jgi:hypothetical protein
MADATYSSVQGALEQRIRKELARQPNRAATALNILPKRPGKGKNVAWDISVGTGTGQVFDDGEDVATYNNDTELLATMQWAEYGDAFAITGRAEDAAAGDNTELAQLWVKKLVDASQRAAAKLNSDLWTGAGSASPQILHGLHGSSGPLDSTGTYATIVRGTYTQFAGNKLTNSGVLRPISLGLIESAFEAAWNASGTTPEIMLAPAAIFRKIAELVAPEKRYMQSVNIRGQQITLDPGFMAVEVNGIPVFRDKDATAGSLTGMNLNHIGIEYLPVAEMRRGRDEFITQVPLAGTPAEQAGTAHASDALMGSVWGIARTGNKRKVQLLVTCQVWCDRPNAHFWLGDLQS